MNQYKAERLAELQRLWSVCQQCPLLCQSRHSIVFGYGNPDAQLLVVGEAPGEEEDKQGIPFIGRAGKLLDQYLASVSISPLIMKMRADNIDNPAAYRAALLNEVFYTNVIMCHPENNRDPAVKEIAACRSRLLQLIYIVDPVIILAVGRLAVEALVERKIQITKHRGDVFDMQFEGKLKDFAYPVLAMLHTSYLLRHMDLHQEGGLVDLTFNDVLKAYRIIDEFNWRHFGLPKPLARPQPLKVVR